MKQMQILAQEPYEAPAIEEIVPVTMVLGSSGGDDVSPTPGDNDDNGGGYDPEDPE